MTVATLLEHSVEGPLGHRCLFRHFGDIHCRQGRCVSIIGPSGSKYAGRDNAIDKFEINTIEALPVMFNYLVAETAEDIELQELFQGLQNGTELKMMTRFYIRKIRQGNLIVERQSCNATIVW